MNHVNNNERVASNVRFDFMAFSRRIKSVFIKATFYTGASGATVTGRIEMRFS